MGWFEVILYTFLIVFIPWFLTIDRTPRTEVLKSSMLDRHGRVRTIPKDATAEDIIDFDNVEIIQKLEKGSDASPLGYCGICGKPIPGITSQDDPNRKKHYRELISYLRADQNKTAPEMLCSSCYDDGVYLGKEEDLRGYVSTIRIGKPNK
jgi:hypothetical protein